MNTFHRNMIAGLAVLAAILPAVPAAAQRSEVTFKQVAPDLHFLFEYTGSNVVVMTTDEGVLVIDTRTHPREGQDLLNRIRKITDKPIKWVINSHFHAGIRCSRRPARPSWRRTRPLA
jgi:glyoxylase-like metal-dependent hydrolase (beta-lactamase superfamily II)